MKRGRRAKNEPKKEPEAAAASTAAGPSRKKRRASTLKSVECARRPETLGEVLSCGQGVAGQLGLGEDVLEKTRFAAVTALGSKIVEVCAGGMHTVCIDNHGNVWTFGCNDEGGLGRGTSEGESDEYTPGKVALPEKAIKVSAGDSHTAALLENGQVFAWGSFRDSSGNLGLTVKGNEPAPVEMLPGHRAVQIASGGDHLAILTDAGLLFTSGCGEQGQLGRVTPRSCDRNSRNGKERILIPAQVPISKEKSEFDMLWAGTHCTFARDAVKGDIYAWGLNNYKQIGIKKGKDLTVFTPRISDAFAALKEVKWSKICGGPHHTLALDTEGVCYVLGRREYGRLGLGEGCEDAEELTPVPALKDKKCTNISCGTASSFAVTDNGDIYAWGMGSSGQLGTGSEDDELEPKLLRSKQIEGRSAINITAGGQHTVLLIASINQQDDTVPEAEKGDTAPQNKASAEAKEDEKSQVDVKADAEQSEEKMDVDSQPDKKEEKPTRKRGRKASSSSTASTESKPAKASKRNGGLAAVEESSEANPVEGDKKEEKTETGGTQPEEPNPNPNPPSENEPQENEDVPSKRLKLDTEENIQESESTEKMDVDAVTKNSVVGDHDDPKTEANPNNGQSAEMETDQVAAEQNDKGPVIGDSNVDCIPSKLVGDVVEKNCTLAVAVPEEKTEGDLVNKTVDPNS